MNFQEKLTQYAQIAVKMGLNIQPGQKLLIRADVAFAPFVREVTREAYRAGAAYVDVMWQDDVLKRIRFEEAPTNSFHLISNWYFDGIHEIFKDGNASLTIIGGDPDLLAGMDSEAIKISQLETQKRFAPIIELGNVNNWVVVAIPTSGWAVKVFPDLSAEAALQKLWETILDICRLNTPDPLKTWQGHIEDLSNRRDFLNAHHFKALHYQGPGTDLTVGLPDEHCWYVPRWTARNGIEFMANIPTEEVFTLGHRTEVEGVVSSTKPLSYGGVLMEDFSLRFENGRVVDVKARVGEAYLRNIIETDDGAGRLGEVALVPHSSPISQSGLLFYNTLYDENASCHLALGNAYPFTMNKGDDMSKDEFMANGGNSSQVHVDFMIGSSEVDIDGIYADGTRIAVMRQGEWTFTV
jgi:aminopeptidase